MNILIKNSTTGASAQRFETTLTRDGQTLTLFDDIQLVTYSTLCTLVNNGQLAMGHLYRIIDYTTTTAQTDTRGAGHLFDIIVLATSRSTISENAMVCLHENVSQQGGGSLYFSEDDKLDAWEIKYCLDNDTDRFAWADTTNGKGVIYYMKDQYGNECPYDFKNIQFKRKLTNGVLDTTSGTDTWVYTFDLYNTTDNDHYDATIVGNKLTNSSSLYAGVHNNKIGVLSRQIASTWGTASTDRFSTVLNNNVFLLRGANGSFDGCYCNEIADNNRNITFGNAPVYNTIANYCNGCTFGDGNKRNKLGVLSYTCTFGNNCLGNILENDCSNTTLGDSCNYNHFMGKDDSNTLGNNCTKNIFGKNCNTNTLGNNCQSNRFGNDCSNNVFATYCSYNTFGNFCQTNQLQKSYTQNCVFENYIYKLNLTSIQTTNSGAILRNVIIETFTGPYNAQYATTISHDTVNDRFRTNYKPQNSVDVSVNVGE